VHIVLAHQNQLAPSLDHALQAIESNETDWSYAAIIANPSRTARSGWRWCMKAIAPVASAFFGFAARCS